MDKNSWRERLYIIVFFSDTPAGRQFDIALLLAIFASLVVIEGSEHGFTSIPASIYWAVVTMTTVGYGDITPKTPPGQAMATLVMITGYSVIAVPTGIFTAELASAMQPERLHQTCPTCEKGVHEPDAAYCSRCGNALFPHRPEPAAEATAKELQN